MNTQHQLHTETDFQDVVPDSPEQGLLTAPTKKGAVVDGLRGFIGKMARKVGLATNSPTKEARPPGEAQPKESGVSRRGFLKFTAAAALLPAVNSVASGCGAIDDLVDPVVDAFQYVVDKGEEALSAVGQLGLDMVTPGSPLDASTIIQWYKNPTTDEAKMVAEIYRDKVIPRLNQLLASKSYKQATPTIKELLQKYLILAVVTEEVVVKYKTKKSERVQAEGEVDNEKRRIGRNINLDKLEKDIERYDDRIEKARERIDEAKTKVQKEAFEDALSLLKANHDELRDQRDTELEPYRKAVSDETQYKIDNLYFSEVQLHYLLRQLEQGLGSAKNAYEKEANTVKRDQ